MKSIAKLTGILDRNEEEIKYLVGGGLYKDPSREHQDFI